jgi:hypothetical protein
LGHFNQYIFIDYFETNYKAEANTETPSILRLPFTSVWYAIHFTIQQLKIAPAMED